MCILTSKGVEMQNVIAHVSLFQIVLSCLLAATRTYGDMRSNPNLTPQRLPINPPVVQIFPGVILATTGDANDIDFVANADAKETKAESLTPIPLIDGIEKMTKKIE